MTEEIDVLIIGAGINGCGTFRDLCAQGVDCLLLERDDFCSGASAGSSRLIHGGLKYLESGDFRLVRESVEERNRLLHNAPHYVFAQPSIIPLRSRFGGILASAKRFFGLKATLNDRGTIITRLGLMIYDAFSRRINALPGFRMLSRRRLDRRVRGLDPGIKAGALYYEGHISHAERLGLELILDGEKMNPRARALNHAEISTAVGGVIHYRHNGHEHAIRPRIIINAGGAWIDRVNAVLGMHSQLMGGSKGAHLVVDNPTLHAMLDGQMIYFGTRDGRVNLVYPFMEDRVLIGSTDIAIDDPDTAVCDEDETAYLRRVVSEILPTVEIRPDQIVYRFSGVRPLPRAGGEIGMVTRDHSLVTRYLVSNTPVHCLIGGKWTTFRRFSAQVTDRVVDQLGRERLCTTENMPIGGGRNFPKDDEREQWIDKRADKYGLPHARVARLLARYGTQSECMMPTLCASDTPLTSLPEYSREELCYLATHERVGKIDDLLRRRTAIAISGRLTPAVETEVTTLIAPQMNKPAVY